MSRCRPERKARCKDATGPTYTGLVSFKPACAVHVSLKLTFLGEKKKKKKVKEEVELNSAS